MRLWVRAGTSTDKLQNQSWIPLSYEYVSLEENGSSSLDSFDYFSHPSLDGNRYIQYKLNLGTDDLTVTPTLKDLRITTNVSTFESSLYDGTNNLTNFNWEEQLPADSKIAFQLRTGPDDTPGDDWTKWCGPGETEDEAQYTFFTDPDFDSNTNDFFHDSDEGGASDRYSQYRAVLVSDSVGSAEVPTLSSTSLEYDFTGYDRVYESNFTSRILDTQYDDPDYGKIKWQADIPYKTSMRLWVRAGTSTDKLQNQSWIPLSYEYVSLEENGSSSLDSFDYFSHPSLDGNRYIQYKLNLGTDDLTVTPTLKDLRITTNVSTFESSLYDGINNLENFTWQAEEPAGSEIAFQLRTGPDDTPGDDWTKWCGPGETEDEAQYTFFTDPDFDSNTNDFFQDGVDDRYAQYRAVFLSNAPGQNQASTRVPTLASTSMKYKFTGVDRIYESWFTSREIDTLVDDPKYGNLRWEADIPDKTSVRLWVRARDEGEDWSKWASTSVEHYSLPKEGTFPLEEFNDKRYIQYRANLGTDDLTVSPALEEVAFEVYNLATFVSSPYDAGEKDNAIFEISWKGKYPRETDIMKLALRAASTSAELFDKDWTVITDNSLNSTSSECSVDDLGSGEMKVSCSAEQIPEKFTVNSGNRFFQYKILFILDQEDLSNVDPYPSFASTSVGYLTNSVPQIKELTAEQQDITKTETGKVKIDFSISDDNDFVTPGFSYRIGGEGEWTSIEDSSLLSFATSSQGEVGDYSGDGETDLGVSADSFISYSVYWDVGKEDDENISNDYHLGDIEIKLELDDHQPYYSTSSEETDLPVLDTSPPRFEKFEIIDEIVTSEYTLAVTEVEARDETYSVQAIGFNNQFSLDEDNFGYPESRIKAYSDFEEGSDCEGDNCWDIAEDSDNWGCLQEDEDQYVGVVSSAGCGDSCSGIDPKEDFFLQIRGGNDGKDEKETNYALSPVIDIPEDSDKALLSFYMGSFGLDSEEETVLQTKSYPNGEWRDVKSIRNTDSLNFYVVDLAEEDVFSSEELPTQIQLRFINKNSENRGECDDFGFLDNVRLMTGQTQKLFGTSTILLQTNPDIVYSQVSDYYGNMTEVWADASDHNVEGYAYDEKLSGDNFASFSCFDDPEGCTPTSTYGVNIDRYTLNFSGYAQTDDGRISFESGASPPDSYAFQDNCINECSGSTTPPCTACYDPYDHKVYGWAQLNGDWIKLHDTGDGVRINPEDQEFEGLSYSTSSPDLEKLYFNHESSSFSGVVDPSDEEFVVQLVNQEPPTATSLVAVMPTSSDLCSGVKDALDVVLEWEIDDSDPLERQLGYKVKGGTSHERDKSSFLKSGTTSWENSGLGDSIILGNDELDYDTDYYWWVKTRGMFGTWSEDWVQFDTDYSTHEILNNELIEDDFDSKTFTTYKHEFPEPNFRWSPEIINQGTATYFTATSSRIYKDQDGSRAPDNWVDFSTSSYQSLFWYTNSPKKVDIYSSTTPTTSIKFKCEVEDYDQGIYDCGTTSVSLEITDNSGYTCATSTMFDLDVVPDWIEVKTRDD
ncbi:MAG TPA: hypothetical protein VKO42_04400 [Patescibacteria group bacterium]|nr:hypothetical protein [Patescibacteria group bacterium]